MGFKDITLGLDLSVPTTGTTNWADQLETGTWNKISEHRHTGGGDGNKIPSEALATNFGWTQVDQTPTTSTPTIDFNQGNVHVLDLSDPGLPVSAVTPTLANPNQGAMYHIIIIQDDDPRDFNWPGAVKWPQGQKPILSSTTGAIDKIVMYYDGSNYLADWNVDYK